MILPLLLQELNMMQQHKDQTQELKQKHIQSTIELQHRQLKALHDLK